MTNWLGIAGDFGGYHVGNARNSGLPLDVFSYTFGPRISIRRRRVIPFAQALFGGGHAGNSLYTVGFQQGSAPPSARNSFAMALGGGLDVNVSRHLAIRAFQADWLYTQFPNGTNNRQNNLRITAGIVFRLKAHWNSYLSFPRRDRSIGRSVNQISLMNGGYSLFAFFAERL